MDEPLLNRSKLLVVTSLLSLILFTVHVADDMVRGIDRLGPQNAFGELIMATWLYGTLVVGEKLSGRIVILIISVMSAILPILHLRGSGLDEMARSPGAFRFIWTLFAIGATGTFGTMLSVREFLSMRRGKRDLAVNNAAESAA